MYNLSKILLHTYFLLPTLKKSKYFRVLKVNSLNMIITNQTRKIRKYTGKGRKEKLLEEK